MTAQPLTLDPNDPFEAVIQDIVALNRRKRADYALDSDPWSNFRQTAVMISGFGHDFGPIDAVLFNIAQKIVRLQALAVNDRAPSNEAVSDTWQDMAVYSIIGMVLAKEQEAPAPFAGQVLEVTKGEVTYPLGQEIHCGDLEPAHSLSLRSKTGRVWRYESHPSEGAGWRWRRTVPLGSPLADSGLLPVGWRSIASPEFPMTVVGIN